MRIEKNIDISNHHFFTVSHRQEDAAPAAAPHAANAAAPDAASTSAPGAQPGAPAVAAGSIELDVGSFPWLVSYHKALLLKLSDGTI